MYVYEREKEKERVHMDVLVFFTWLCMLDQEDTHVSQCLRLQRLRFIYDAATAY